MYERKIPIVFTCGISVAMEVIGSKWKFCLVELISEGITRPKDLSSSTPGITNRVMYQQLKELEFHDIIKKTVYKEVPPRVEYHLTETGKTLLPVIDLLNKWGLGYAPKLQQIMGCNEELSK